MRLSFPLKSVTASYVLCLLSTQQPFWSRVDILSIAGG